MSYGLKVWDPSGNVRVSGSSWLYSYHSTHSHRVRSGDAKKVNISGLNPNTWGVYITYVDSDRTLIVAVPTSGGVWISNPYGGSTATVKFIVFRG